MKPFNLSEYLENPTRKVCTRDGKPVRIVCTDSPNPKCPIYGFVEGDTGITSWRSDGSFSNLMDSYDLFFADQEEELTEFEKMLRYVLECYSGHEFESESEIETLKLNAKSLLELARKQLNQEMIEALRTEYEKGKADALKDLPKWKKATEHKDLEKHIAILEENKVLLSNYLEEGDYYIELDDLKTLSKE